MKSVPLLVASCSILIATCKTPDTNKSQTKETITQYEGERGMKPGIGFESVFEEVRGECVSFEIEEPIKTPGGQQVIYNMKMIENHRELAASLQVSSASQIKAAVPDTPATVSARTKFAMGSQFNINRYSVYLLLSVQVKNETTHLKNIKFREEFKKHFSGSETDDIDALRQACGDSYMSAFTTGGEFYGLVEIQTESDEAKAEVKNELQAKGSLPGVGSASSTNSLEASLKRIASQKNVKIWSFQLGGAGEEAKPVSTIDEMMARSRDLVTSVQLDKNPRNISATFADYFTLDLSMPKEYRNGLIDARMAMSELARIQGKLMDQAADIDFIFQNPNSFLNITPEVLKGLGTKKEEISENMRKVYNLGIECYKDFKSCSKLAKNVSISEAQLPQRRKTLLQVNSDALFVTTKVNSVDVNSIYDGWFNGPECYVFVRALNSANPQKLIPLRRTSTVPGCSPMTYNLDIPISLIESAAKTLGTTVKDVTLEVSVYEDDPSYDDLLVSNTIKWSELESKGATVLGLQSDRIIIDVGLQIK